jgi:hypothetical protein
MRTFTITWRTETRHQANVTAQWLANLLGHGVAEIEARTPAVSDALTERGLPFMENAGVTTDHAQTNRFDVAVDDAPLPGFEQPSTYVERDIGAVLNALADDILQVTDAGDEGLRDAVNLMVNATLVYLRRGWHEHDPAAARQRLTDIADSDYDSDLDAILGWIQAGVR